MVNGKAQETTHDEDSVCNVNGIIGVPRVDGLIKNLLSESHGS